MQSTHLVLRFCLEIYTDFMKRHFFQTTSFHGSLLFHVLPYVHFSTSFLSNKSQNVFINSHFIDKRRVNFVLQVVLLIILSACHEHQEVPSIGQNWCQKLPSSLWKRAAHNFKIPCKLLIFWFMTNRLWLIVLSNIYCFFIYIGFSFRNYRKRQSIIISNILCVL